MLVPSSSPLPTNSQTPMSAQRIARQRAQMARVDRAEKIARFGVLGFCAPAISYGALGLNIMADAYQTPQVPVPNVTSSSLVTSSGSGVLDSSANLAPPQPTVIPIDGSGDGVPNDPEYLPLTLQMRRAPGYAMCPTQEFLYRDAVDSSQAPDWGDAQGFALSLPPSSSNGILGWIKANPLLSGALILGGLAIASKGTTRRNRGRR